MSAQTQSQPERNASTRIHAEGASRMHGIHNGTGIHCGPPSSSKHCSEKSQATNPKPQTRNSGHAHHLLNPRATLDTPNSCRQTLHTTISDHQGSNKGHLRVSEPPCRNEAHGNRHFASRHARPRLKAQRQQRPGNRI